ncbi:hypothetical protein VNO80_02393 [Phaseolus coccineus]|uniref:Uncharacterized protein n=1 Tax=Phaseolus coccineus TaxID=3886 RepID=A0AAN9NWL9_PHACN
MCDSEVHVTALLETLMDFQLILILYTCYNTQICKKKKLTIEHQHERGRGSKTGGYRLGELLLFKGNNTLCHKV